MCIYGNMKIGLTQFFLDIGRMEIFFDGTRVCTRDPDEFWRMLLRAHGMNPVTALRTAHYFTQECLSTPYVCAARTLPPDEHLLSGGAHRVYLQTMRGCVRVEKEFRHALIVDGEDYTIDYCTLTLTYDPWSDALLGAHWSFDFHTAPWEMVGEVF